MDALTFDEALECIEAMVGARAGGFVFTPNVDHVVIAEEDPALRAAYDSANLVLVDGQPLIWASRLLRTPLPEKISGSDLLWPLMALAARKRWRVYFLGGAPGVADAAAARIARELAVDVVGVDCPEVPTDARPGDDDPAADRVRRAAPDVLLVALGSPKQERWISRNADRIRPAVAFGIGAALDFVAGRLRRAPRWMSHAGLEWLHRMSQDPRRLARRYLLRDPRFLGLLSRTLVIPRAERVRVSAVPRLGA